MNLISSVLLFVGLSVELFVSGERSYLLTALSFAQRHPAVIFNILLFSTCGSVAQVFIFGCLEEYGGFLTTTICTTRKIVQVLLSVAIFGHKVEFIQWLGIVNVFAGLAIQTYCGGGGLELAFVEHTAAATPRAPISHEQKKAA
jgi:UDP-galactose transporter B1